MIHVFNFQMYDTWKHDVTAIDVAEHNPLLSIMVCHMFEFCFVLFFLCGDNR